MRLELVSLFHLHPHPRGLLYFQQAVDIEHEMAQNCKRGIINNRSQTMLKYLSFSVFKTSLGVSSKNIKKQKDQNISCDKGNKLITQYSLYEHVIVVDYSIVLIAVFVSLQTNVVYNSKHCCCCKASQISCCQIILSMYNAKQKYHSLHYSIDCM